MNARIAGKYVSEDLRFKFFTCGPPRIQPPTINDQRLTLIIIEPARTRYNWLLLCKRSFWSFLGRKIYFHSHFQHCLAISFTAKSIVESNNCFLCILLAFKNETDFQGQLLKFVITPPSPQTLY